MKNDIYTTIFVVTIYVLFFWDKTKEKT